MATIDERVDDLSGRVQKLEDKISLTREEALKSEKNLSELITKAVSDGNKEIKMALDKIDKRVDVLENCEANKALEKQNETWKTIRAVAIGIIVTFFVTLVLNNYVSIIADNQNNKKEVIYNENIKIYA